MPGFDGTGPRGMGPRTGGGRGFCTPGTGPYYGTYGTGGWYAGRGFWPFRGAGRGGIPWGGGRGRAFGGGRGRGWYGLNPSFNAAVPFYGAYPSSAWSPEQELAFLKNQSAAMEQEIEDIRGRIAELSKNVQQDST